MKTKITIVLLSGFLFLTGCVVAPPPPYRGYNHGYYNNQGDYNRGYYDDTPTIVAPPIVVSPYGWGGDRHGGRR
jgi:hypothetical protein